MSAASARAFWITAAGRGEIRDETLPTPGAGDVLVQALFSGISRGTESLVLGGHVPPGEFIRMRAPHQAGEFPFPIKYGYAAVGRVLQGPAALRGRTVFCLYPHQTQYVVPADAIVPLPDGVPPGRAVLAALMETALNGVWDAQPAIGDRIAVLGAGVLGCLVAHLLSKMPGTEVMMFDTDDGKHAVVSALGIRWAGPGDSTTLRDLVFNATGNPDGLRRALDLAAPEATIVELSWYGDRPVELPLGGTFHSKRLTIRSSQVGRVSPHKRGQWTAAQRLALALSMLDDPRLDRLIDGETAFFRLPERYASILAPGAGTMCHRVIYDA